MERVWLRVLAYAWKWRDGIAFDPGFSEPDAPDLLVSEPGGRASLVVRVARPEPARHGRWTALPAATAAVQVARSTQSERPSSAAALGHEIMRDVRPSVVDV